MPQEDLPPDMRSRCEELRATGRFEALKPFWRHRSDRVTAKGWILPDGTAVSIDGWHYEWILAHQDRVESLGQRLKGIPIAEIPVRIAAVQAGCFRVNYELRHGDLTIEGLESRFTGLVQDAVFVILIESLEQIGTVRLHLFDETVERMCRSVVVALGSMPTTADKLREVDDLLGGAG